MLKAVKGFTLPDETRVEANTLVENDFTDRSTVKRLKAKGVLIPFEPESAAPATHDGSPAVSDPAPSSPTSEEVEDGTEAHSDGDES